MNLKTLLVYAILHSIKLSYAFLVLIAALTLMCADTMPWSGGFFKNFLILSGVLCGTRLVFGGWASSSLKGMTWQVILSTVGALIAMIGYMHSGDSGIHVWPIIIVLAISVTVGVACYNFINNLLTESTDIDMDDIVDSVFSYGVKDTFNGFMDMVEGNMYYAASRGVAAYSNTVLILGLFVGMFYS